MAAAVLGTAAGLLELALGTNAVVGDKNDPTTLGLVTMALAVVVGAAAVLGARAHDGTAMLAAAVVTVAGAAIGLTTAGLASVPAAAAGGAAGATLVARTKRATGLGAPAVAVLPLVLVGVLDAVLVLFGVVGGGVVALLCALAVAASVAGPRLARRSRRVAWAVLAAGVLPLAVVGLWTVVLPLTVGCLLVVEGAWLLPPRPTLSF